MPPDQGLRSTDARLEREMPQPPYTERRRAFVREGRELKDQLLTAADQVDVWLTALQVEAERIERIRPGGGYRGE